MYQTVLVGAAIVAAKFGLMQVPSEIWYVKPSATRELTFGRMVVSPLLAMPKLPPLVVVALLMARAAAIKVAAPKAIKRPFRTPFVPAYVFSVLPTMLKFRVASVLSKKFPPIQAVSVPTPTVRTPGIKVLVVKVVPHILAVVAPPVKAVARATAPLPVPCSSRLSVTRATLSLKIKNVTL